MNLERLFGLAAAFAAVTAAAAVCVVAGALAVYGVARLWLTPAGSAAVVAALFAALSLAVAWTATRKTVPKRGAPADDGSLIARVIELASARPLVALCALAAAVTVILKNPKLLTAVLGALTAGAAARSEK